MWSMVVSQNRNRVAHTQGLSTALAHSLFLAWALCSPPMALVKEEADSLNNGKEKASCLQHLSVDLGQD